MSKSSERPLVSVIMAAYNASAYIEEAIQSVLDQTYTNWELIIVNDGSTDNTHDLVDSLNEDRITTIHQDNRGVSAARNNGLRRMRGEFVCFLDSDDVLTPDSLSIRLKVFDNDPSICFSDGAVEKRDQHLEKILDIWTPSFQGNPLHDLVKLSGRSFFGPTWMIRSTCMNNTFFEEGLTHGEDLFYYIELASIRTRMYDYSKDAILHYRVHPGSAMSKLDDLARGYKHIHFLMSERLDIEPELIDAYDMKTNRILLKSYVRKFRLLKALEYIK